MKQIAEEKGQTPTKLFTVQDYADLPILRPEDVKVAKNGENGADIVEQDSQESDPLSV